MTVYEVRYSPEALDSLRETVEFIAEDSGPERAVRWLRAMQAGIGKLETSPRAFRAVSLRRGRTIHSKPVLSHRVFYFVEDITRTVLHCRHRARSS